MPSFGDELGRLIPQMRRFARALVRGHGIQDSDDLVQETVVLAMRSERISRGVHLRSWCFSTLMRLHRHREQISTPIEPQTSSGPGTVAPAKGPVTFMPKDIGRLDMLPLESREVLLLTVLVGMNYAEAGDTLHVGVETVMMRLDVGRAILARGQRPLPQGSPQAATGSHRSTRTARYLHVVK